MQGKIALEEHFAIEATLGDSQVFGAHVWKELRHRLIDVQDTRLREMDKHGIEMMILSLNAPAVQAIHDVKTAIAVAQAGQRRAGRRGAQAPRPLRRLRRAADAGSGSGHRRAHPLRQGARLRRRAGQRLFADRQRRTTSPITTCRNTGRSGARSRRSTCRSICTRAIRCRAGPRQYEGHNWLLGPNWAFSAETAVHALRLIGSGLFDECPNLKIVLGHLGEGIPGAALAHRRPQRLDEGAA